MKPFMATGILALALCAPVLGQEQTFTQVIRPEDFSAAGLSKLSPEERAALDKLVAEYKSGALEAALQDAHASALARASAEARARDAEAAAAQARESANAAEAKAAAAAAQAQEKAVAAKETAPAPDKAGFFGRAKALISPGTKVEYQPIETRIIGSINGWEPNTIFALENGQRWAVADNSNYFNGPSVKNPAVKITSAGIFGFDMEIKGMRVVRVRLVEGPPDANHGNAKVDSPAN